ncbi:MAG: TPM domain-containing protein [Chitinophagaceae bacterium]|nr:TPM domain-containing protein [Chitinophagaceae bacterium]
MNLLPPFKKRGFFSSSENDRIVNAIRKAETTTSGEIRVYIESRCRYVNPLDRAAEVFWNLKMDHTELRNSTLLYVAMKDHQFAIYADQGIHQQLGDAFWQKEAAAMSLHFRHNHYIEALLLVIEDIGSALMEHFPYDAAVDKNELPDDIVFGK